MRGLGNKDLIRVALGIVTLLFILNKLITDPYLLVLFILIMYAILITLKVVSLRSSRFCPVLVSLATLESKVFRSLSRYLVYWEVQRYLNVIYKLRWVKEALGFEVYYGVLLTSIFLSASLMAGLYLGVGTTCLVLVSTASVLFLIASTLTPYIQSLIHMSPSDRDVVACLRSLGFNIDRVRKVINELSHRFRKGFNSVLVDNIREVICLIPLPYTSSVSIDEDRDLWSKVLVRFMSDYVEDSINSLLGTNVNLREDAKPKLKYVEEAFILRKFSTVAYTLLILTILIISITASKLFTNLLIIKGYYIDVLLTPSANTYLWVLTIPALIAFPPLLLIALTVTQDDLPHVYISKFLPAIKFSEAFTIVVATVAPLFMVRGLSTSHLYLVLTLVFGFITVTITDYSLFINTWETSIIFYAFIVPCVQYLITGMPKLSIATAMVFLSTRPLVRYLAFPYLLPTSTPVKLLHSLAVDVVVTVNACLTIILVMLGVSNEVLTLVAASVCCIVSYLSVITSLRKCYGYYSSIIALSKCITKCSTLSTSILLTYVYVTFINPVPSFIRYLHDSLLGPLLEVVMFLTVNMCFTVSAMLRR